MVFPWKSVPGYCSDQKKTNNPLPLPQENKTKKSQPSQKTKQKFAFQKIKEIKVNSCCLWVSWVPDEELPFLQKESLVQKKLMLYSQDCRVGTFCSIQLYHNRMQVDWGFCKGECRNSDQHCRGGCTPCYQPPLLFFPQCHWDGQSAPQE